MDQENSTDSSEPILKLLQDACDELPAEKGEDGPIGKMQEETRNGEKKNVNGFEFWKQRTEEVEEQKNDLNHIIYDLNNKEKNKNPSTTTVEPQISNFYVQDQQFTFEARMKKNSNHKRSISPSNSDDGNMAKKLKKGNTEKEKTDNIRKSSENIEVVPEMRETKEFEKPGPSKAMEKGQSIMSYSQEMTMDKNVEEMMHNLTSFISPANSDDAIMLELIYSMEMSEKMAKERLLKKRNSGKEKTENIKKGSESIKVIPEMRETKEFEKPGPSKAMEKGRSIMSYSKKMEMDKIVKEEKKIDIIEMEIVQRKLLKNIRAMRSIAELQALEQIDTADSKKIQATEEDARKNLDIGLSNSQTEVKAGNGKLQLSKKKSSDNMNKSLVIKINKFENEKLGKSIHYTDNNNDLYKVFYTCDKNSTDKTSQVGNIKSDTPEKLSSIQVPKTKTKHDSRQQKMKNMLDKSLNETSSSSNNHTIDNPDSDMENEEKKSYKAKNCEINTKYFLIKVKYEGGKYTITGYKKDGTCETTDNNKSSTQMNATRNTSTAKIDTTENTSDKERHEMKVFQKHGASNSMEYDKT